MVHHCYCQLYILSCFLALRQTKISSVPAWPHYKVRLKFNWAFNSAIIISLCYVFTTVIVRWMACETVSLNVEIGACLLIIIVKPFVIWSFGVSYILNQNRVTKIFECAVVDNRRCLPYCAVNVLLRILLWTDCRRSSAWEFKILTYLSISQFFRFMNSCTRGWVFWQILCLVQSKLANDQRTRSSVVITY